MAMRESAACGSPCEPVTRHTTSPGGRLPTSLSFTGAAGGVLLRPFARLISKAGDSVTTYGEPWNMN